MPDMSMFGILNTALTGIHAHKLAMNIVGHNIANASTPGYSRQRPVIEANPPIPLTTLTQPSFPLQMGTGARVKTIVRLRDAFLDVQYRQVNNRYNYWDTVLSNLHFIEQLLAEPGEDGIRSLVDNFWNAFKEVMSDPSSTASKAEVVSRAQQMVSQIKDLYGRLEQLREDIDAEIVQRVSEINQMIKRLADLNNKIRTSMMLNSPPNDLLDERDRILDELSNLANINYTEAEDGQITLRIGNQIVLNGSTYRELRALERPYGKGYHELFVGNSQLILSDGKLKALIDLRDSSIVKYMRKLDEFVLFITDSLNLVHRDGFESNGVTTNLNFFKKIEAFSDDPSIFRIKGNRKLEMGPYHTVTGLHSANSQAEIEGRRFNSNDVVLSFDGGSSNVLNISAGTTIGDLVGSWNLLGTSLKVGTHAGGYRLYLEDSTGSLRNRLFLSLGDSLSQMGFDTETKGYITIKESDLSGLSSGVYNINVEYILEDGTRQTETISVDLSSGVNLSNIEASINSSSHLRAQIYADPSTGENMLVIVPDEQLNFDPSAVKVLSDDDFFTESNAFVRNYEVLKYKDTLENIFYGQTGFDPTRPFTITINSTDIEIDPAVDTLETLVEKINEKNTGVLADLTPHHSLVFRASSLYDFDLRMMEIKGPQGFFEAVGFVDPDGDPTTFDWNTSFTLVSKSDDFTTLSERFKVADILTFDRAPYDEPLNIVNQFEVSSSLATNPANLAVDVGYALENSDWNATSIKPSGGANPELLETIQNLYTRKMLSNGKESFYEFFGGVVSELGVEAETASNLKNNTEILRQEIDNAREEVKGVSLDEEMANMIEYQHAFSAAAKVITAVDQMIQTVINMVG
ncbi:flagellar hook protein FlgK [Thermotoga maritima MSB8]|uniref:Flagellar hook-associated protein 1 n=1 Tax=Thermotoga maritima (strain ATCC 43589 / DSM 3109 / JCM 10099 / NBRC 100826 / MSB8) TaxID=243274 RepID=Q9WXT8_THEMA|nr:flagellar hook-associated protein FlgK [Thermotoga maritima]AAD35177.1 flagellar hook-associated protein 1 [Thermotoga maritima MSB8]AGL49006.1 Flagellar hook-associated protein FlgK [Thermotoga maritima MSB8]AHD18148.1 flagellar hook-associated protein FlgK [Thermotoga maritima MSB8]AKE26029.1 flagellar hook protein FlgK [Thermotoga maritima]AKE27891.1 flagellar hook protein FlgK [Thermotoga maritima MSB8]